MRSRVFCYCLGSFVRFSEVFFSRGMGGVFGVLEIFFYFSRVFGL